VGSWLRLVALIAAKDLRVEVRSKTALLSSLVFAALVLVVFNFARDATLVSSAVLAPSVLWITIAFAAVIALNRAFNLERENSSLSGLLLAPIPRGVIYAGKFLANLAFVAVVELVTLPLFVLFFNVDIWHVLGGLLGDDFQCHGGADALCGTDAPRAPPPVHGAPAHWGGPGHHPAVERASVERNAWLA
jgi:ABC-type Na+ efflux pump permease subunit